MSRRGQLFIVSAPSGTGKSTVLGRVLATVEALRFSVSHTTRAPRPGERDGVEYYFVTRESFAERVRAGGFLEWATVHDELYGTSLAEYERARRDDVDLLLDIDVQGAAQVRARVAEAVSVFLLPPSRAVLADRLRGRGGLAPEVIERRLRTARNEVARAREYDYVVVNADLDECVRDVVSIVRASRRRTTAQGDAVAAALASFNC